MEEFELGFLYGATQASEGKPFDIVSKEVQVKSDEYKYGVAQGYSWGTVNAVQPDSDDDSSELDESSDFNDSGESSDEAFEMPTSPENEALSEVSESRKVSPYLKYMKVCDSFRLQKVPDSDVEIYKDDKGTDHLVEKYSKSNAAPLKARLQKDKLTIVGQDDENVYVETADSLIGDGDADDYSLEKVNNTKYTVLKNGVPTYELSLHGATWQCTCPGFKYRHKCRHIALLGDVLPKRHPITEFSDILPTVREVLNKFGSEYNESTGKGDWCIVGSYRRGKSTYKDVDILIQCSSSEFSLLAKELASMPGYKSTMTGNDIIRGHLTVFTNGAHDIDFDVTRVRFPNEWGSYLLYRTGSKNFNLKMRGLAKSKGLALNEHGLFDKTTGQIVASETEDDIFKALGLKYIEPRNREM